MRIGNLIFDSRKFRGTHYTSLSYHGKVKGRMFALGVGEKGEVWNTEDEKIKFASAEFRKKDKDGDTRTGIYIGRFALVFQTIKVKE
jgi:hypothetical protein